MAMRDQFSIVHIDLLSPKDKLKQNPTPTKTRDNEDGNSHTPPKKKNTNEISKKRAIISSK